MKLIRYAHAAGPRIAQLDDGKVVDPLAIDEALGLFDAPARRSLADAEAVIAGGAATLALIAQAREAAAARGLALPRLADVTLLQKPAFVMKGRQVVVSWPARP